MSDAAFREAVLGLLGYYQPGYGSQGQRDAALVRVLALYAARPAEEGEEYEVQMYGGCCTAPEFNGIALDDYKPGDRVTVRRCGGGV